MDRHHAASSAEAPIAARSDRAAYQAPVLRNHGALRDLTALIKHSHEVASDVHTKENVVAVAWG